MSSRSVGDDLSGYSVSVDTTRCISSGLCVARLPEVFDQDEEEGLAFVRTDRPDESFAAQIAEAADLCPSRAISVVES